MNLAWKHRKAEDEVARLLQRVVRVDPDLIQVFPRPVEDLLCAVLPVSFESHAALDARTIVDVLGDVYGVDHRELLADGNPAFAGYTFARGERAVVFSDPQFGEGFERFTRAHEAGHLVVEYLPILTRAGQVSLFGGEEAPTTYARRDPAGHLFLGDGAAAPGADTLDDYLRLRADHSAWLREVVANGFAAELLAPHRGVRELLLALPTDADRAEAVRTRFGLSSRAAEVRLADLGVTGRAAATLFLFD